MNAGTIALVVSSAQKPSSGSYSKSDLLEVLSDDVEIQILEEAIREGVPDPLSVVYEYRQRQQMEDEQFGDYVEDLLSQPFVQSDIQEHGLQWFRSKIRIEQYQKSEKEARQVIADYAYQVFQSRPEVTDFTLVAPTAEVRIKVFLLQRMIAQVA